MSIHRIPGQVLKKSFFIVLLVLLVFQSFGINGVAAPAASPFNFQGGGNPETLTCVIPISSNPTPTFCNIQIVLMIDDSGSMTNNDPQKEPNLGLRNQGARNVVDLLATKYYLPAVQLIKTLNEEKPELNLQPPHVQVAVIHFANEIQNTKVRWMDIAPSSLDEWNNDPKKGHQAIDDVINLQYANLYRSTSFKEPFEEAQNLFASPAPEGDCTRRSIMLFTDGIPEDRNGPLVDTKLNPALTEHMSSVANTVMSIQENQAKQNYPNVDIYITGFKIAQKSWDTVANRWTEIAKSSSGEDTPEHTLLLTGDNVLTQLPNRMDEITAKLTGLQRKEYLADSFTTTVPNHVQTLRFTLYNLDPKATLTITDPNGQILKNDDKNVVVSGDDSAIEKWDLNLPLAGDYQVATSKSGGIITELLTYQNMTVEFNPVPARLQENQSSDLKFKLLDSAGNPVLPGDDSAYTLDLQVFVTQDNLTERFIDWNVVGDEYQVSWTPSKPETAIFSVEANMIGINNEKLLSCTGTVAELPVDTPSPVFEPPTLNVNSPEPSCILPGEVITVPVRLEYTGEDRSWMDTLKWVVNASAVPDTGQPVQAEIKPVNASSGDYQVMIQPVEAETIQLTVSASAVIDGESINISDQNTHTITICETPPVPPPCFPIWLIFVWLLMGFFILLLGWVYLRDGEITIHFWILIALEIILAIVWFILFKDYLIHLFWMLVLIAVLLIFLYMIHSREIKLTVSWWLSIVLTLFISIWFVVFAEFPFWLILLLLLMWLGILVVIWIYLQTDPQQTPWLILLLLLILFVICLIYFSAYWIFLLLWLLVTLVLIVVIRVIGPICPPIIAPPIEPDNLKRIEGIGPVNEKILNEHGIYTFEQLAYANGQEINKWFDEAKSRGYKLPFTRPYSWPYQAWLADRAKKTENPLDQKEFEDAQDKLKGGVNPEDYYEPEKSTKNPRPKRKKPEGDKKPRKPRKRDDK